MIWLVKKKKQLKGNRPKWTCISVTYVKEQTSKLIVTYTILCVSHNTTQFILHICSITPVSEHTSANSAWQQLMSHPTLFIATVWEKGVSRLMHVGQLITFIHNVKIILKSMPNMLKTDLLIRVRSKPSGFTCTRNLSLCTGY